MTTRLTKDDRMVIYEALTYAISNQCECLVSMDDATGPEIEAVVCQVREFLLKASALKQRLREEVQ